MSFIQFGSKSSQFKMSIFSFGKFHIEDVLKLLVWFNV